MIIQLQILHKYFHNPAIASYVMRRDIGHMKAKKLIIISLISLAVSACSTSQTMKVSQLYTGYEGGSWYKYSPGTCSAKLCPAF
jgi:hypothetical protein